MCLDCNGLYSDSVSHYILAEKFDKDIAAIQYRLSSRLDTSQLEQVEAIAAKLREMFRKLLVKSNHSVMEVLVATFIIEMGYQTDVEHPLEQNLVCDVYGRKSESTLIAEIETGFVPPEHALDPVTYIRARLVSKIARYSKFADRFLLATPVDNVAMIPNALSRPPRVRSAEEIESLKKLCDAYYTNPPISLEEIGNARLNDLLIVNVDELRVAVVDPETYLEAVRQLPR